MMASLNQITKRQPLSIRRKTKFQPNANCKICTQTQVKSQCLLFSVQLAACSFCRKLSILFFISLINSSVLRHQCRKQKAFIVRYNTKLRPKIKNQTSAAGAANRFKRYDSAVMKNNSGSFYFFSAQARRNECSFHARLVAQTTKFSTKFCH